MEERSGPESGSSTGRGGGVLPVVGAPVPERADAARNRVRVLEAAAALHAEGGVAALTTDAVAARAGVGKGTIYRRFTDKGGLAAALLDERGRRLQERMLAGPPPLGPGAPPLDRLAAFVVAYVEHTVGSLDLVLLSETATPGGRLAKPVYPFWRRHVEVLLEEAGAPAPRTRAEALLAALAAEQLHGWTVTGGRAPDELAAELADVARALAR
ncbi:TetR/AcrR family transcriptional regulator [Cellulomonas sp. NPDC057328]|uniref:TetR/AcrR family transcriptional regulator n=1 Tax=Cellulomonas sp. NPDC057328 TaxID=3346101 RepID=UPI003639918F